MNSVILIGRLTKEPELRYTPETQTAIATFTLAVDRPYVKDKDKQQADFIRVIVFGKQAENCERFLSKGRMTAVQGRLQTGSYKDKDGKTVYTTDVVGERVKFLERAEKNPDIPEGFQEVDDDYDPDDDVPF